MNAALSAKHRQCESLRRQVDRLEAELAEAQRTIKRVRNGVKSVRELIDNSRGVDGLHLNGDVAYWDELEGGGKFEEWLAPFNVAEAALEEDTE